MPSEPPFRYDLYPTGRKVCSCCGAWKQLHEFGAYVRMASNDQRLKSRCRACDRINGREWNAKARGYDRPYRKRPAAKPRYTRPQPRRCPAGHLLKGEGKCRTCKNEYNRFWEHAKRRNAGAGELDNNRWRNRTTPVDPNEELWLPAQPFVEWCREQLASHSITDVLQLVGVEHRTLYRWLHENERVHIDVVDRALINAGKPYLLNELYPV